MSDDMQKAIREGYSEIAKSGVWLGQQFEPEVSGSADDGGCCVGGSCCGGLTLDVDDLAEKLGYDPNELARLPKDANLGLSCGNPAAIGSLEEGDIVLDLGSGAGFDVFLSGPKVGATGRVIGVDMTSDMLNKARANTKDYEAATGLANVEFRLGEIEHLPTADNSVDVVISNCVVNLSSRKTEVWAEVLRALTPGGRVAISDIALLKPLPEAVGQLAEAWVGCIAGAVLVDETRRALEEVGFTAIELIPDDTYVRTLVEADDPLYRKVQDLLPEGSTATDYITSLEVRASKPTG
jgi:arsenite methyltransferase